VTGYLQRLAASASVSRSNLHPMIGSIFGEKPSAIREISDEEIVGHSPRASELATAEREVRSPSPAASAPLINQRDRRSTAEPTRQHPSIAQPERREVYQPLFLRQTEVEIPGSHPESGASEAADSNPTLSVSPIEPSVSVAALETAERTAAGADLRPPMRLRGTVAAVESIRVSPRTITSQALGPLQPNPVPMASTLKETAEPASVSRVERGSGDVEIHIGRIEVVAVPPPAPRAATPPVSKATRLEDYLRQRNRGAG
jgi:hypothetical protein